MASYLSSFVTAFPAVWSQTVSGLVDRIGKGPTYVAVSLLCDETIGFWPVFLGYRAADKYGFLDRWKTNPGKQTDEKLINELWSGLRWGHWVKGPMEMFGYWAVFLSWLPIDYAGFPTAKQLAKRMAVSIFGFDFLYYWFHRWEHLPSVYKWLHKRHHDIKITNVYGSQIASFEEHHIQAVMGMMTKIIATKLFGMDLFSMICMDIWGIWTDLHIHCGYTVPFFPFNWFNPQYFHDFHHAQNRGNFSAQFGIPLFSWDYWMGTHANWARWRKREPERLEHNTHPFYPFKEKVVDGIDEPAQD